MQTLRSETPSAAPSRAEDRSGRPTRPYPGVRPFTASDADAALFCGRDAEREIIRANLVAARLTVLYGPSGVGKTSILRAGVVHDLNRDQADPDEPRVLAVIVDRWDGNAVGRIVQRAYEAARARWPAQAGDPIASTTPLHDALGELRERVRAQIFLIFDQFEELFVYHPEGAQHRLDHELPAVLDRRDPGIHLLIAIREDALAALDRFKGRIPGLFDNRLGLARLSADGARTAIERPVERFNDLSGSDRDPVSLEPGLVDVVIGQLAGHRASPGGGRGAAAENPVAASSIEPAYLQLVMARLFDAERAAGSSALRIATLHRLGDATEIIRRHVDEATGQLPRDQQDVAARAFRYLVTPSGGKVALTSADLALYTGLPEPRVEPVLERLSEGESRILRAVPAPAGSSKACAYEIFHDALAAPILEWSGRLRELRLQRRVRRLRICLAGAIAIAVGLALYLLNPHPLERAELQADDLRFAIRGAAPADRDIVIVAVDDRTVNASGDYPLYREEHAKALERILAGRPRAVVFDFTLDTPSDRTGDAPLQRAIAAGKGKVVIASYTAAGEPTLFGHPVRSMLARLHARVGYGGVPFDRDGELRHMDKYATPRPRRAAGPSGAPPPPPRRMPTLALETARLAGWRTDVPDHAWIDYRGPERTFRTVSHLDAQRGRVSPRLFRNKVVVIGETATGRRVAPVLRDRHPTPAGGGSNLPGPEIQADILSTIHRGAPLRDVPHGVIAALIVILGALGAALGLLPTRWRAPALALGALLIAVAAQLSFDAGWILPVVAPLAVFLIAALASFVVQWPSLRRRRPARPARSVGGTGYHWRPGVRSDR
jgi:CHASE2 domain-containing sensor protein